MARPDHPILLGSLAANQGDIRVFGTRYSINRGEISFFNSVKIEPVLDLDLETETRGITVDITIAGTLNKLNITYRSDPPLQPRDIIALLTVGHAPDSAANTRNTATSNNAGSLQFRRELASGLRRVAGLESAIEGCLASPTSNRSVGAGDYQYPAGSPHARAADFRGTSALPTSPICLRLRSRSFAWNGV